MGKLDTVTVNGPEDEIIDWDAVQWHRVEDDVRRLRQRIFTATQAGDLKRVRNLQKLMLRSRANALCSVRRVTEINAGRKTAGVDGRVVLEAWEKAELATWLQHGAPGGAPSPSSGCSFRRRTENSADSEFLSSPIGRFKPWRSVRWNPSGRPGSNPDRMDFGRAAAARTRCRRSS